MLESGRGFGTRMRRGPLGGSKNRGERGNMIILVLAILMGILMLLLAFSLSYVRMLGSNQEQKTSIEAAALAAARELGRIVIEDPNFGFISLSDAAPSTPNTKAEDGFALPVTSINTILGTIRLDMIIARELNDRVMIGLADQDYTNAMAAKDFLNATLQQAILPGSGGGNYRDVDGNVVNPYDSAVEAYQQNVVRMAGGRSRLVNGSMKLALGCLSSPAMTATPLPNPQSLSSTSGNQSAQGFYNSYVDCQYGGKSFIFAGIGKDVKLVDAKNFTASASGLAYTIPTIVKAEADHMIESAGAGGTNLVHATACAQPATVHDPRPAPGGYTVGGGTPFPTGMNSILDMMTLGPVASSNPVVPETSFGGDSPGGGSIVPAGAGGGTMSIPQGMSTSLYDWIRRAGTKANISAVKTLMTTPFKPGVTNATGSVNVYTWAQNGDIHYVQLTGVGARTITVSENQGFLRLRNPFSAGGKSYIIQGTDECRQPGRMRGGRHAGEPLVDNIFNLAAAQSPTIISGAPDDFGSDIAGIIPVLLLVVSSSGLFVAGTKRNNKSMRQTAAALMLVGLSVTALEFLTACGGGGPSAPMVVTTTVTGPRTNRPTYTQNGLVCDITIIEN